MSGGVDSSAAAALLEKQGYEVVGVTLQIWPKDKAEGANKFGGCCGLSAIEDAQRVCSILGIPHYVMNFRRAFEQEVIFPFTEVYMHGRTPNPCLKCNEAIKFGIFLEKALALGADYIATGHYARIEEKLKIKNKKSKMRSGYVLKKGIDKGKDQSYFLYTMTQEQLAHTLMPLGHLTKEGVRKIAKDTGLPVAEKEESQEICFIPDNNYRRFLKSYLSPHPGPIVDRKGNVLGTHKGIINYTIGQRKGLRIASSKPLYVLAIDARKNAVVIGDEKEIYDTDLTGTDARWIEGKPEGTMRLKARIRYNMEGAQATVKLLTNGRVRVAFNRPQRAITPGQAVVFYHGDLVVGGATISSGN